MRSKQSLGRRAAISNKKAKFIDTSELTFSVGLQWTQTHADSRRGTCSGRRVSMICTNPIVVASFPEVGVGAMSSSSESHRSIECMLR